MRQVVTCRGCGASAPNLAALPADVREMLETPEYRALTGAALELPFLRWAMLAEAGSDRAAAASAVLEAAWAVDDAGGDARALRARAAALWGEPATIQDALRLVDVERRAGAFDRAGAAAAALLARTDLNETDAALLRFQQGLIADGDAGRHLLSSALRPPVRTPHVTHGRQRPAPSRSVWQRLTGR
jgi:hypothetical protein